MVACGGNEDTEAASSGAAGEETGGTAAGGAVAAGGGAEQAPLAGDGCGDPAEAREVAEDPSFELRATASGPYAPGEEGRFDIALTPRGIYHVNAQYPLSIQLQAPGEITLPDAELGTEDAAEFGEPRARFQVPFTATAAGQHRVTARVDFAVCTPESCMPDCRTLALVLPVETGAAAPTTAVQ
jgi:hypothetical protein